MYLTQTGSNPTCTTFSSKLILPQWIERKTLTKMVTKSKKLNSLICIKASKTRLLSSIRILGRVSRVPIIHQTYSIRLTWKSSCKTRHLMSFQRLGLSPQCFSGSAIATIKINFCQSVRKKRLSMKFERRSWLAKRIIHLSLSKMLSIMESKQSSIVSPKHSSSTLTSIRS